MTNLHQTSGSIFAGNPITIACTALDLSDKGTPSFHRVIFNVEVADTDFQFSHPVTVEGGEVEVDISSALRAVFDAMEWTPDTSTPPSASWKVTAHEEWMFNGTPSRSESISLNGYTVFPGAFSDLERITGNTTLPRLFSHKPSSSPEIVSVGDTLCLPVNGNTPSSTIVNVTTAGKQTSNAYAIVPTNDTDKRHLFRFINTFGCLESISCPRAYQKQNAYTTTTHVISKQERFNAPSHTIVRKLADNESWRFSSGPVDKAWQQWFLHDFLMTEHVWMLLPSLEGRAGAGSWLRAHIIPEETITYEDETKNEYYEVLFTAQFDINGSLQL